MRLRIPRRARLHRPLLRLGVADAGTGRPRLSPGVTIGRRGNLAPMDRLPPGSQDRHNDANNWVFPVGTKIWQECKPLRDAIETRLFWKEAREGLVSTTFAWAPI